MQAPHDSHRNPSKLYSAASATASYRLQGKAKGSSQVISSREREAHLCKGPRLDQKPYICGDSGSGRRLPKTTATRRSRTSLLFDAPVAVSASIRAAKLERSIIILHLGSRPERWCVGRSKGKGAYTHTPADREEPHKQDPHPGGTRARAAFRCWSRTPFCRAYTYRSFLRGREEYTPRLAAKTSPR